MMATTPLRRRGLTWAIVGGVVLLAGIAAVIIARLLSGGTEPGPTSTGSSAPSGEPSSSATVSPGDDVVDPAAVERGWTGEPITTDPDTYIRAALEAASTFDTQKSTRDEWLDYLDTWFTRDTRYASEAEQDTNKRAAQLELRQGVVLPGAQWDSLAGQDGRVVANVHGDVTFRRVPDDSSGDMFIGTADVVMTFTTSDGSGREASFDETVTVAVQVICGPGSVPTPDTAQHSGDCKVVRYFSGPQEP